MKNKWFWVSAILLVVILIMAKCMYDKKNETVIEKPVIVSDKQLTDNVTKDEDTAAIVIQSLEETNKLLVVENNKLSKEKRLANEDVRLLEQQNIDLANQLAASELTDSIKLTNSQLAAATRKSDSLCNKNISNLNKQLFGKDNIIAAERKKYGKLKSNFDTCLDNQRKLSKYSDELAKQSKPKRELTAGLRALSNYSFPLKLNVGIEIGYRNKKGMEISGGYYTNEQISVGIKKTFLRF